jgi:3-oxoacyl-(acyl-carrier-protein) synthase
MGIKSTKNVVVANAVEAILQGMVSLAIACATTEHILTFISLGHSLY